MSEKVSKKTRKNKEDHNNQQGNNHYMAIIYSEFIGLKQQNYPPKGVIAQ